MTIEALIFDKDGTLFDFHKTWSAWADTALMDFADADPEIYHRAADAFGFDTRTKRFRPDSPVIAGTLIDVADLLTSLRPEMPRPRLISWLEQSSHSVPQIEVTPLWPLLTAFRQQGLRLAVMTNDSEEPARAHLRQAGIADLFDIVIGADSGFGAKPDAAPLQAIARMLKIRATDAAVIGDSLHDLHAARSAGMTAIGVLTGLATAEDLAEAADLILPDISHLPAWLDPPSAPSETP
ncbi:HAD family hydrolase [Aestuariibius insulae]|uniref:HAD family hydrolase n=1 Tax=Aestuariibius insulae TaxID=2058287 RepID=UPI00345E6B84